MMSQIRLPVFLLALCLLLGCGGNQQAVKATGNNVAVVNGQPITAGQFEAQLRHLAKFRASRLFSEDQKKVVLLDMVNFEMLLQAAVAQGLHLQDEEIRRLLVTAYLRRNVNNTYTPSEAEIRKVYDADKATIDNICIRHIMIGVHDRSEKQALERLDEVRAKLAQGHGFGALAASYSDDRSNREFDGNLGCINSKTAFVPEFLEAAFKLKTVGEISPTVRTPYGFHIIQLTADNRSLAANRLAIAQQLENQRNKAAYEQIVKKMRDEAHVDMNFARLPDINLPAVETPFTASPQP